MKSSGKTPNALRVTFTNLRNSIPKGKAFFVLLLLGTMTLTVQVGFIREFLGLFDGNELVIGSLLAIWMLLTGLGAHFGRKTRLSSPQIPLSFFWLGILPLLQLLALYLGKISLFPGGSMVNILTVALFALVIESPFCLLSGMMFTRLCALTEEEGFSHPVSKAYAWESLGSFAGALIFNVILIYFLKNVQVILLVSMLSLLAAAYFNFRGKKKPHFTWLSMLSAAGLLILIFILPALLARILHPGERLLFNEEGPYGKITVTEKAGQKNFYSGTSPLFFSDDPIEREESVHYALLQRGTPRNVLLVGGSLSGQVGEVLKYKPEKVEVLEINPLLLKAGKETGMILHDPRVVYDKGDARTHLVKSKLRYDGVLIILPEPATAQINRYYTLEFFREVKKKLVLGGVVSLSLRSTADYVNPVSAKINSTLYYTMKSVFRYALIVPGSRNYVIASDRPLFIGMAAKVKEKGLDNLYVNGDYINDTLLQKSTELTMEKLDIRARINRDFHPVAYFHQIRLYLMQFSLPVILPMVLILGLLVFYLLRLKKNQISLFITGFTAASIQFLMIIAFQAMFGYVYFMIGLLMSVFMLGLALGVFIYHRLEDNDSAPSVAGMQVTLGAFALVSLIFLLGIRSVTHDPVILGILFHLMVLAGGTITAMQFTTICDPLEANALDKSSRLYSADLLGSALGALLVSAILFPGLGLIWACVILAILNAGIGFAFF